MSFALRFPKPAAAPVETAPAEEKLGQVVGQILAASQERTAAALEAAAKRPDPTPALEALVQELRRPRSFSVSVARDGKGAISGLKITEDR